jgi:hypothetical protein
MRWTRLWFTGLPSSRMVRNQVTTVWDFVNDAELARFTLDRTTHTGNRGEPASPTF